MARQIHCGFDFDMYFNLSLLQMNIMVSSSRGGGLAGRFDKTLKEHKVMCNVVSGGRIEKLTEKALTLIPPTHRYKEKTHIYIMAGLPDITVKTHKGHGHYTECIYMEDTRHTINRVTKIIREGAEAITKAGAMPIFCTINSCDIEKYNKHLLTSHETSYLKHQDKYKEMQERLEIAIIEINAYIVKLNSSISMSTPYCHAQIHKRRGGSKKGYYKWLYDRLWDGVHGTDKTKDGWAHIIGNAIKANRIHYDTDTDTCNSPKRSWKSEKRQKISI